MKKIIYGSKNGLNLKSLPSLLKDKYCTKMQNIFYEGEGILKKRKGYKKIIDLNTTSKITMCSVFKKYILFTHKNILSAYDTEKNKIYTIKNDFSLPDPFSGVLYGDFFYLCNGGDKIGYIDENLSFKFLENSPKAKILFLHDEKLFAGNIENSESKIMWSNRFIDNKQIPFSIWTTENSTPRYHEAGNIDCKKFGKLNSIANMKNKIIGFFENGKICFSIEAERSSRGILYQNIINYFEKYDFGGDKSLSFNDGVFYINESGIFHQEGHNTTNISESLGTEYFEKINLKNADIIISPDNQKLLITCSYEGNQNNTVLYFDIKNKIWSEIKGWNIECFSKDRNDLYAGGSLDSKIYKLFRDESDDGEEIEAIYETSELSFGDPTLIKKSKNFYIKGKLCEDSEINVKFDIWDKKNSLIKNKKTFIWKKDTDIISEILGIGEISFGEPESIKSGNIKESFGHKKINLKNYLKTKVKIREKSCLPLEINIIGIDSESVKNARKNNLS
ncbi:MAG: hypothetical protein N4A36_04100 [Candidatus Gracilibacteria bacterium]|jgi:hypothetical protein|nr:hypothetical protein [Candidatus Gracilibacteria bacterium]